MIRWMIQTSCFALVLCTPYLATAQSQPVTAPTSRPAITAGSFGLILPSGMAPCTVHVNATELPLMAGTPLTARYEWDFGDEGSAYNRLVGFTAAHTYDRAGKYTLTLRVTDETGGQSDLTANLNVAEDTRRAVYVAANGFDTNPGADPEHPIRSWERAARLVRDNTKILFRAGDTFDMINSMRIKSNNVILGSYGGTPPATNATTQEKQQTQATIRYAGPKLIPLISGDARAQDLIVENLTFDSVLNSKTDKKNMPDAVSPVGVNTTIRNCLFLNLDDALNANSKPRGVLMQDNSAPLEIGIRGYFAWAQGSDFVFLGNDCANSTREHVIRCGGTERVLIAFNRLSNLDRSKEDKYDTLKGAITVHKGSFNYIANNYIGKGPISVGPLGDGDGVKDQDARTKWSVIENNQVNSWIQIHHGNEHLMARNNVVWKNDFCCFLLEGLDKRYTRVSDDITIVNNTGISISGHGNFFRVTGKVSDVTLANNLYAAGKLKIGEINNAPVMVLADDLSGFRSITHNVWPIGTPNANLKGGVNFLQPKWNPGGYLTPEAWNSHSPVQQDTFAGVLLDDGLAPAANSPAGTGAVAWPGVTTDINGKIRPISGGSVGAVQR